MLQNVQPQQGALHPRLDDVTQLLEKAFRLDLEHLFEGKAFDHLSEDAFRCSAYCTSMPMESDVFYPVTFKTQMKYDLISARGVPAPKLEIRAVQLAVIDRILIEIKDYFGIDAVFIQLIVRQLALPSYNLLIIEISYAPCGCPVPERLLLPCYCKDRNWLAPLPECRAPS